MSTAAPVAAEAAEADVGALRLAEMASALSWALVDWAAMARARR